MRWTLGANRRSASSESGRRGGSRTDSAREPPHCSLTRDITIVARLKLHFDGWLALPARLRTELALQSGAELEAEIVDGAIVLRPAGKAGTTTNPEPEAVEDEPAPSPAPAALAPPPTAKGRRGRPKARSIRPLPVSV